MNQNETRIRAVTPRDSLTKDKRNTSNCVGKRSGKLPI